MLDLDTRIALLLGKDLKYGTIGDLHSLTINEILGIGFKKYNKNIGLLTICKDDINEMFDYELEKEVEPFEFIFHNCLYGDEDVKNATLEAFTMVFNEEVRMFQEGFYLGNILEERTITAKNFGYFSELLKLQNCVQENKNRLIPKNDKQKAYMKRLREVKAKMNLNKENDELYNIISAVSAKENGYSLFNIEKLTIFQLIEQFKRICSIEDYGITFQSMMHGASSEKVKLKHWSEPLE